MNDLTTRDIVNLSNHIPKRLRSFVSQIVSNADLLSFCRKVKANEITRKEFIMCLELRLKEHLEKKRIAGTALDSFNVGDIKTCVVSYWAGKQVEIVEIDPSKHFPIRGKYNGITYMFQPDWFAK